MVIPTFGAINAFLAIYRALPPAFNAFVLVSLFSVGGVNLLKRIIDI